MTTHADDSLEDLRRQLTEQDARLERLTNLADDVPSELTVQSRTLDELDALFAAPCLAPFAPLPLHGLRA